MPQDTPRIFFSYASEDKYWVDAFRDPHWFGGIGTVGILDYAADDVGGGELQAVIDMQLEGNALVLVFVSENYRKKSWTVSEWEKALSESQRRRLIFVPLMLDADAKIWWRQLRQDGKLTALSRDYQYVDFTDAGGRTIDISPNDSRITGKIARLAQKIIHDLREVPPPLKVPAPSAAPQATAADKYLDTPYTVRGEPNVVILGHPTAALPPEMGDQAVKLRAALEALNIQTQMWSDGWRKNPNARVNLSGADLIFVQPVSVGEASDRVSDPGAIGKYLDGAAVHDARVVLWLPSDYRDPDFEEAAKKVASFGQFPVPRTDAADHLAQWLSSFARKVQPADDTRIQIQTVGLSDEMTQEQGVVSQRIIKQLQDILLSIADEIVDPPPTPPPWQFWGSQFRSQLRMLRGNRTIIAIHDLDVRPGNERSIVKQLQIKFETIQKAIDEEQESRVMTGRPPLNAFLMALLVNNAEALPFSSYPDDGRYARWRLLGFAPPGKSAPDEAVNLKPDPASLAVFRSYLFAWAHSPS